MTKIDSYAFEDCGSLTSMNLPEGLTEFGERVFDGCKALVFYSKFERQPKEWDIFVRYADPIEKCVVIWGYKGDN